MRNHQDKIVYDPSQFKIVSFLLGYTNSYSPSIFVILATFQE